MQSRIMSKYEKRLERLTKKPPATDLRWEEFVAALESLGFVLHEKSGGSSHKYFVWSDGEVERRIDTSRPHPSGIMKVYQVREVVTKLEDWGLI